MSIYIYIHTSRNTRLKHRIVPSPEVLGGLIAICMYRYIYIYIERERDIYHRSNSLYIYIYMFK